MIALHNIHIINEGAKNINIKNGKIIYVSSGNKSFSDIDMPDLHFENVICFPGLINSHDHLEFNLFPQLGNQVYESYMQWGADIHNHDKAIISAILKIPKQLRAEWGMYKNLLNGITTVVQHGAYFKIENPAINIFQDCYSLHSVGLEKNWKLKLNKPFAKNQPFVIHTGEGTNVATFKEINELVNWNLFKRKIVAVHGVAMNSQQAKSFEALIWCPDSNFFLLNATAKVNELKKETSILFGTDSTVSAGWNIWEQLRLAKSTGMLTNKELFDSLTVTPAQVWKLPDSGAIAENKDADIVVAKMKYKDDGLNSFLSLDPEDILLILRKGVIILFDETLLAQLSKHITQSAFSKIFINGKGKFVRGDLPSLINRIKKYYPEIKFPIEIE